MQEYFLLFQYLGSVLTLGNEKYFTASIIIIFELFFFFLFYTNVILFVSNISSKYKLYVIGTVINILFERVKEKAIKIKTTLSFRSDILPARVQLKKKNKDFNSRVTMRGEKI